MPSTRRRFLAAVGASGLAGTASCLAVVGRDLPVREVGAPVESVGGTGRLKTPDGRFRALAVGDRDGVPFPDANRPVPVRVWNDADRERTLRIRLTLGDDGTVFDRRIAFPADDVLVVDLREPNGYELAWVDDGEARSLATVAASYFDCNESVFEAAVRADGRVESAGLTTTLGCPWTSHVGSPF
ncbi:hypothetical protein BRC97_00895 [Halobacteriales archaeon QS_6_71_20]|nr:MAG: hypothetical protein BRC97_00895 [Halobacteriales archaeon QS_6_71_20]